MGGAIRVGSFGLIAFLLPFEAAAGEKQVVRPSALRVLADKANVPAEVVTYRPGDIIWEAPLAWAVSAKPRAAIPVIEGAAPVPAGALLRGIRIDAISGNAVVRSEFAFCYDEPAALEMSRTLSARQGFKPSNSLRLCFTDSNGDEKLDAALVVGLKGKTGAQQAIPATGAEISDRNISEDARVRVQFNGTQFGTSNPYFDFQIILGGRKQTRFYTVEYFPDSGGAQKIDQTFSIPRSGGWPQSFKFLGGSLRVDYDGDKLRLAWEQPPVPGAFHLGY
ncbi:hypothetical protein [Sphingomonas koreensis]